MSVEPWALLLYVIAFVSSAMNKVLSVLKLSWSEFRFTLETLQAVLVSLGFGYYIDQVLSSLLDGAKKQCGYAK